MPNEYEIEIVETNIIDGGIEVFARAWKNGVQLGFGKDGTIDIERFRIFNPPILVEDRQGDIVQEWTHEHTGESQSRTLKEDPQEAIIQSLIETISLVGKDGRNIVAGKVGNTTSTFYSTEDAWMDNYNGSFGSTWNEAVNDASGRINRTTTANDACGIYYYTGDGGYQVVRSFFTFDTASTIDSGDTISSATVSFYGSSKTNTAGATGTSTKCNVYGSAPADPTLLVVGDFDSIANTAFSTGIAYDDWSTSGYNNFALNASGIAAITKTTGYTNFATSEEVYDAAERISSSATDPSLGNNQGAWMRTYYVDQTGTANDPKLVVEHSAAAPTFIPRISFIM